MTTQRATPANPPYRLYVAVLLGFLLLRFADLATQDMDWTVWVYESRLCRILLSQLALLLGYLGGKQLRHRVPRLMAWLLCGLIGGAAMLLVNSAVGAVLGALGGALALFAQPIDEATAERCGPFAPMLRWLPARLVHQLPAILGGSVAGCIAWLCFASWGQRFPGGVSLAMLAGLALGGLGGWLLWRRLGRPQRWYQWLGTSVLFVGLAMLCTLFTAMLTSAHHQRALRRSVRPITHPFGEWLVPQALQKRWPWLEHSIDEWTQDIWVAQLDFLESSDDQSIAHARAFPGVISLNVEDGSRITDAGFARLSLQSLRQFRCTADTQLTDASIRRLPFRQLESLDLSGPRFGDASLHDALSALPRMQYLFLQGTQTSSDSIRQLDVTGSLWMLNLSNTQVDDEALATCAQLKQLAVLSLAGTRVTGTGLHHFRGSKVHRLDLADTPLDESNLVQLLAPEGTEPDLWNEAMISSLSLAGVPLTSISAETLGRMPNLQELDIRRTGLDAEALHLLARHTHIRRWTLDGMSLTPELLAQLTHCPTLDLEFDAREQDVSTIVKRLRALSSERSWEPYASGLARGNRNFSVTIGHLHLAGEAWDLLHELDASFEFFLRDVTLKDGSTHAHYQFPDQRP